MTKANAKSKLSMPIAADSHAAFAERLLKLEKELGSARRLAALAGVSNNAVHLWLRTSEPARDNLIKVARATNVSISWLAAGEGEMRPDRPPQGYQLPAVEPPLVPPPLAFSEKYFAYLVEISASRGHPWLLRVEDDAMEPTLRQDDLVIVDATQLDNLRPRPGEPAATIPAGIWFLSGVGIRRIIEWRRGKDPWKATAIVTCDNERYASEKREIEIDWRRATPILGRVTWRAGRI